VFLVWIVVDGARGVISIASYRTISTPMLFA
jgi:hypothetical protein